MKPFEINGLKSSIAYSVLFVFLGLLSLGINSKIIGEFQPYQIGAVLCYILPLVVTFIILLATGMKSILNRDSFHIGSIFSKGWYAIFSPALILIISIVTLNKARTSSVSEVIIYIIACIFTASFEELLFRGVIQNINVRACEVKGKEPWLGILITSAIFAVSHFANLIEKPFLVIGTVSQVLYTLSLGIMFGTAYYFSKNIITVIALHAVFNILGGITEIWTVASNSQADISIMSAAVQLIIILPGIAVARAIYNRNKAKELQNTSQ